MRGENTVNWYKVSQQIKIKDMDDRNLVNDKIHYFEALSDQIFEMARIAFHSQKDAKNAAAHIVSDQTISSYPLIRDIMSDAEQAALDSPWRFRVLCKEAMEEINIRIEELRREREEFSHEHLPARMKEWWTSRHGS